MAADQGFAVIPLAMVGTVSASAVVVYLALAGGSNADQISSPTKAEIAEQIGLTRKTVGRCIAELRDAGWIQVQERYAGNGGRVANAYLVHRVQMGAA